MKDILTKLVKAIAENFVSYDATDDYTSCIVLHKGIEYRVTIQIEEINRLDYAAEFENES